MVGPMETVTPNGIEQLHLARAADGQQDAIALDGAVLVDNAQLNAAYTAAREQFQADRFFFGGLTIMNFEFHITVFR